MADYQAPLRDMRFVLNEVFDAPKLWQALPALAEVVDAETADAILEEAGKITANSIAPLNRSGDEEGCRWDDGAVSTPAGYREAYQLYAEGGWVGVGGDPAFGGMGMPKVISAQVEEMMNSASLAFGLYPMLTSGACLSIYAHASEELKQKYLPNMYAGVWSGSMCLTEPHAGTDLGIIRTKAEPQADGSYKVSGTKIFITGGEHDLTDNIIHLVLAKLPDAPAGSRGISLFLVPKVLVNDDGSLGERNSLSCGSIEHKMGIQASATCVMNFDGATGWMVGEPNKGLAAMFTMMNYERLGVGIQGLATGERSYQSAIEYARERIQSRAPTGPVAQDKAADPIIVHPDVRRMLLTMKALNEGGRAFSSYVALQLDIAKFSDDEAARQRAEAQVALLTPVAKAFLTDMGLETTVHGQQVFGGHGFIREWGQEQLVRDCRITQIYEGTNGIQALDLVGRKIVGSGGTMYQAFVDEIRAFVASAGADLREFTEPLKAALDNLDELTAWVIDQAKANPNEIGAASVEYLHVFGYTAYAYMWARMAAVALAKQGEGDFYQSKLGTARFYFARLLPRIHSLTASVKAGSESLYLLDAAQF
ncbi:acyl-CoA dehydrogenase C-terminal domain-containing protein [Pseudomonas stutzeri]|jgi:alkylation response protein AidB-like acyl-CoA dehydrogenase|uniref:3-methylmercaptopropionyl-CoA dehydrogenase n=2 Tax=Stutzerimonas stutzeri TaxID=316 RepID=A0AA42TG57_STUST|nr:acyl-CoA dehydrogenase C-terminal domain-containing protein [Stutzerimonas stutzeri]MCJ0876285.1 acyl-CoA dehydrogenase C-terminal domain-containing protein [Pseudomonas sp. JI-2]HCL14893.1 acyl-CoA dehydrogenase [Pseudomonas sp.]MCC8344321.1 acyl-CoA dehydrogenase C-terminal domain-containing protein [Stutzerimonas stutzeri]MDH0147414.1 acyl-CoA dehydrogenase C-terminal domain-containing protein [Stutzerimonas stutzeri]MDH0151608.1 acyl-CoA dehydrogenase C-terminal domain-containing protei